MYFEESIPVEKDDVFGLHPANYLTPPYNQIPISLYYEGAASTPTEIPGCNFTGMAFPDVYSKRGGHDDLTADGYILNVGSNAVSRRISAMPLVKPGWSTSQWCSYCYFL